MEVKSSVARNWQSLINLPRFVGTLKQTDFIGSGNSGDVYRYEEAGKLCAVRSIRFNKRLEDQSTPTSVENINLLLSLQHENLVKLHRFERDNLHIYVFQDLTDGGNLRDFIRFAPNQYLPEETVKSFTVQILRALEYLHAQQVTHGSVKPKSLLLDKQQRTVKLAISRLFKPSEAKQTQAKDSLRYLAPEVVKNDQCGAESDVWSLGATIVEMLTGKPPFSHCAGDAKIISEIIKCEQCKAAPDYTLTERSDLSMEVKGLLESIFQPAEVRPSASELLSLDYFRSDYNGSSSTDEWDVSNFEYSISKPKGRHLIINNQNYNNSGKGLGSRVDEDRLRSVFEGIGFSATIVCDLRGQKVKDCINEFVNDTCYSNASCVIISILAHGSGDDLFGIDGEKFSLREVYDALSDENAPKLAGKPKLIIVQACNSTVDDDANSPVEVALDSTVSTKLEQKADDKKSTQNGSVAAAVRSEKNGQSREVSFALLDDTNGYHNGDSDDDKTNKTHRIALAHCQSDFLVAYSATSGYVSWRNQKTGSYFIQALCTIVDRYWHSKHVLDMLTMATSRVASIVYTSLRENCTQVPQFESTLRKMFFLSTAEERDEIREQVRVISRTSSYETFASPPAITPVVNLAAVESSPKVSPGEMRARTLSQGSSRGNIQINECAIDGKYIMISSKLKEQDITGWKIVRQVEGSKLELEYTFPKVIVGKAENKAVRVWAKGYLPPNPSPNDLEAQHRSWGCGLSTRTTLFNAKGESCATYKQTTIITS